MPILGPTTALQQQQVLSLRVRRKWDPYVLEAIEKARLDLDTSRRKDYLHQECRATEKWHVFWQLRAKQSCTRLKLPLKWQGVVHRRKRKRIQAQWRRLYYREPDGQRWVLHCIWRCSDLEGHLRRELFLDKLATDSVWGLRPRAVHWIDLVIPLDEWSTHVNQHTCVCQLLPRKRRPLKKWHVLHGTDRESPGPC